MKFDPYGYGELLQILKQIEMEVRGLGCRADADALYLASQFIIGSPSEFLAESKIALKRVIDNRTGLAATTVQLVVDTMAKIDQGFCSVGDLV